MPDTGTRKQRRLTQPQITEVSAVDFPAHMHDGWIFQKSSSPTNAQAVLAALGRSTVPQISTTTAIGMLKSLSKEQRATITDAASVTKALTPEQGEQFKKDAGLADLQPVADALAQAWASVRDLIEREDPETPSISPDGTVVDDAVAPVADAAAVPAPAAALLASPQLAKALEGNPEAMELVKALVASNEAAAETLRKERESRADEVATAEFAKSFDQLGLVPADVAPALRRFEATDPTAGAALRKALTDVQTRAKATNSLVTKELGHSFLAPEAGSAADQLETIAKGLFDARVSPTIEQARAMAMTQNPGLYDAARSNQKGA